MNKQYSILNPIYSKVIKNNELVPSFNIFCSYFLIDRKNLKSNQIGNLLLIYNKHIKLPSVATKKFSINTINTYNGQLNKHTWTRV